MTKEQMIQLLDTELDAMNKHRSNIERIKRNISILFMDSRREIK